MWVNAQDARSRRQWTAAEKLRIVTESWQPGSSANLVARRYRISPNLIFRWRRMVRQGLIHTQPLPTPLGA